MDNIDTKIEWCELQLKLATGDDSKCEYSYELANLRFKKHLEILKKKAHNITTKQPSTLNLLKKHLPIKF